MGDQTRLAPALSLMVVSHACLQSVNRSVYRFLHREYDVPVHLVIPRFNDVGEGFELCGPVDQEPVHVSVLEPVGRHLRLRRLKGLGALIALTRPSHVLVEADPATRLVSEVIGICRPLGISVWSLTAGNSVLEKKAWPVQWLESFFLSRARRHLSRVFTVSHRATEVFEKAGFADRVTQVPLGFDPLLFFPQSSEKIAHTRKILGLKEKTIGYFGRLAPEKGIETLLEALACQKGMRWQLLLDDFKPTEYTLSIKHRIREYGLNQRVVFFSADYEKVADYMNACHLAVVPSRTLQGKAEQYGRVAAEAMACGKLVVASDSGALPELIGDKRFIFEEGNVSALSRLLERLLVLTEEELCELGKGFQERARKNLSIETQAARFWDLLEKDERVKKAQRRRDALGFLQPSDVEVT